MEFRVGDPVMHCTYGLGTVVGLEERNDFGEMGMFYCVEVSNMTIWVRMDDNLENRLRPPTPQTGFKELQEILTSPGEPLPKDRQQRRLRIRELLKDGRAQSLCRVIRDLAASAQARDLNENDRVVMKRLQSVLIEEWGFAMSVSPTQAMQELRHLLTPILGAS